MDDPPKLCSCGCGQPRDREGQRYRRECFNAYKRKRERQRTAAVKMLKRAGLTVSAGESGFAVSPQIVSRQHMDGKPK